MPTYLRITVDTDLPPAASIDAVTRALGADRMRLPDPGVSERSTVQDDAGRTIGTIVIYTQKAGAP